VWKPLPDGTQRCDVHDSTFSRIRTCPGCDARKAEIRAEIDPADAPVAPPTGCRSAEQLERTLNVIVDDAIRNADSFIEVRNAMSQSISVKWTEVALKAIRASGEYARSREDWVRLARLEQRKRALKNRGAN
jgi:hypothetical protein